MKYTVPIDIIELEANSFHVFIDITIHGKSCRLLLDTGASKTVFDTERILRFVTPEDIRPHESKSVGLGVTDMETGIVTLRNIALNKFTKRKMEVAVLPIGHVNNSYQLLKIPAIDGVLGSDFMVKYMAVINLRKKQLTLFKRSS